MRAWTLLLAIVLAAAPAAADGKKKKPAPAKKEPPPPPVEAEEAPPPEEPLGGLKHVKGPKLVALHPEIEIDLPDGAYLLEKQEAVDLVKQGGGEGTNVIGALVHPDKNWLVLIEYDPIGYVTDSDANELDATELFESYQKGTIEQNKKRVAMGVNELFLDGWSEKPRYEKGPHHLVWGLDAHTKDGPVINFFTNILGRGGYVAINLIDEAKAIEASKVETASLRAAIHFKPGFKYEDYREGDKSSGIGLRALVVGGTAAVVAKKAGIIAAILIGLKKFFIFIAAGLAGFFKWITGRKKKDAIASEPPPPDPTPSAG